MREEAPPTAKAERMIRHIKKGYAKDGKLTDTEKKIAYATAWKQHNKEEIERHGVKKDASKSELKKIRSSSKSSKGAKQLAHWKLNMHHKETTVYNVKDGNVKTTVKMKKDAKHDEDKMHRRPPQPSHMFEAVGSAESSLKKWKHKDAVKVARFIIKAYGQPDEVTETMLKWYKLGDFGKGEKETWIIDESIPHDFPAKHHDFLYTSKEIVVPAEMMDTLGHVTGSIIIDGLKKTVTARCGSLNANASTLGFVDDLVKGKVPNDFDKAKKEYAKRIKTGAFLPGYKDRLDKYYKMEEQQKEVVESLKDWFGKGPKGDWVRVDTKGKIKGACAREPGEGKPKCMPRSKAHSMSKKDRGSAARRKRAADPSVDRPGTGNKPINVKTQKETKEYDSGYGKMEWGTDVGDDYYRRLTPGQTPKNKRKQPLKPVDVPFNPPFTVEGRLSAKIMEKCWQGYKRVGMKKKGNRMVPNCVKEDVNLDHIEPGQAHHSKHQYPIDNEVDARWAANVDGILTGAYEGGEITMQDVKELEAEVDNYTFEDAVEDGLYDQDELENLDFGYDLYDDYEITEALSVQGRMKRRFAARRNRQKLRVARRIALRRGSTPDRLKRRAVRGARLMVYKRLLRGRDRAGLPPAEKARLERMITRFQPLVNRISVKLLPQMRRNEIKRLTNRGKSGAQKSKKYRAAKPIKGAASYKAKRYKIKAKPFKAPKKAAPKSRIKSGGPTLKKASKAYKAFSYSVG